MGQSVFALLLFAATVSGPAPRELVERSVQSVLEVIDHRGLPMASDRGASVAGRPDKRRAQIRAIAEDLFDFEEVARRALSVHWAGRTPAERAEFTGLFTDLLERAYMGKIESYAGETILYTTEKVDGDFALVRSRIVPKRRLTVQGRETGLEYRLLRREGRWKVSDVLIDGVSFVSTYRSQFDRIIKGSSYAALVDRLRDSGAEARLR